MSNYGTSIVKAPLALAMSFVAACAIALLCAGQAHAAVDGDAKAGLAVGTTETVTTIAEYGNDSANTTGYANIRTVYRFGWVSGGNNAGSNTTYKNLDVTGDGWADTIKVAGTKVSKNSGYLKRVKVTVNGEVVASYTNTSNKINRAVVSVVTLKNKQPFLWFNLLDGKGNGIQRLYQYNDGDFDLVLSNKDVAKSKTSNQVITDLRPTNNKIDVTYTLSTTATGITKLKYSYNMQDGVLVRASDNASSVRYVTNQNGGFSKNKLTAAGTFTVYKSTDLKKAKYTVKSGKKVSIEGARLVGKKLLYKVKYNGKTGWISCPTIKKQSSKSPTTLFYETYGKVSLNTSIPKYSKTSLYSAKTLQKYNDHALFVARNEILAHHGQTFTNRELNNRFKSKSWWSSRKTSLNNVEIANVNLILSIEQARGSLYVV